MTVTVLLWFGLRFETEPKHNGKSLSEWMRPLRPAHIEVGMTNTPDHLLAQAQSREARLAIRVMGTNALPALLIALNETKPPLLSRWPKLKRHLPELLTRNWMPRGFQAVNAFEALGDEAAPAISELTRRLRDPSQNYMAMQALAAIGKSAIPELTNAALGPDPGAAFYAFHLTGTNTELALPILIQRLQDKSSEKRWRAVNAVGNIFGATADRGRYSETRYGLFESSTALNKHEVIPRLTALLRDPNPRVREFTARALGNLMESSWGSIDLLARAPLQEATKDDNAQVARLAGKALEACDAKIAKHVRKTK